MSELYSAHAHAYAQAIRDNVYNAHYDRPSLLGLISGDRFEHVLDMGCGPGAYLEPLLAVSNRVAAVDGSRQFVDMAQQAFPQVRVYLQDLNLGLPREADEAFNLVLSGLTVHYIEDLCALFSEVARVLRPGGLFVFSTHHPAMDFESSPSGDYFKTEQITQLWNTLPGREVEVSFFRRPLSATMHALAQAGLLVEKISEGVVSPEIRERSPQDWERLSRRPAFLFVRAVKR